MEFQASRQRRTSPQWRVPDHLLHPNSAVCLAPDWNRLSHLQVSWQPNSPEKSVLSCKKNKLKQVSIDVYRSSPNASSWITLGDCVYFLLWLFVPPSLTIATHVVGKYFMFGNKIDWNILRPHFFSTQDSVTLLRYLSIYHPISSPP